MLIDKESLKSRIENMFWLSENWDGFGTPPISRQPHDIALSLVDYIDIDVEIKVFVGVQIEGSICFEIIRPNRIFEFTVKTDGIIDYSEYNMETLETLSDGSFILSGRNINEILL